MAARGRGLFSRKFMVIRFQDGCQGAGLDFYLIREGSKMAARGGTCF